MRQVTKYDRLRFRYEYEGVSITELCAEYGYIINDFQQYADEHSWEQVDLSTHDPDQPAESLYKDYTIARRKLTYAAIRRAMSIWHRVQELEDSILDMAEDGLSTLKRQLEASVAQPQLLPPNIGLEISRLAKVIESVMANNKMFTEALEVASLNDSDRKDLGEGDLLVRAIRRIVDPNNEGEDNGQREIGEEVQGQSDNSIQDQAKETEGNEG